MTLSLGGVQVLFLYLSANYPAVFSLCTFLDVYYIFFKKLKLRKNIAYMDHMTSRYN